MNPYLILPTLKSYLCGKKRLETNHYYVLRKPTELSAALDCQRITIQYHPKNEKEKKRLIEIIHFLNQRGKDVTVTEFERIFDDDLLLHLAEQNFDFKVCLRYMLESYHSGTNVEMEYSLQEYQEIMKKVKYFKEKVEENCTTEEEKLFFAITQLTTYIRYTSADKKEEASWISVSDFYASIGRGESVCIGYAMAFWKILTELQIPCHMILGYVPCETGNEGHAWNQVLLNGVWYNVDLTWFSGSNSIAHLLQDDQNFSDRVSYVQDQRKSCLEAYPRERIRYFLEIMKKHPNYLEQYEMERRHSF